MTVTLYAEHPESGRREWGTYPSLVEARAAVEAADDALVAWFDICQWGDAEPPADAWPEGFDAVAYDGQGAAWVLIDDWHPAAWILGTRALLVTLYAETTRGEREKIGDFPTPEAAEAEVNRLDERMEWPEGAEALVVSADGMERYIPAEGDDPADRDPGRVVPN